MVSVVNFNVCLREMKVSADHRRGLKRYEKLTEMNQTSDMNTFTKVNDQNITIFYHSSRGDTEPEPLACCTNVCQRPAAKPDYNQQRRSQFGCQNLF